MKKNPPLGTSKKLFSKKDLISGFTLIELLLVRLLIPLIGFTVYANFSSGVRVWQRLHQPDSVEDLLIFTQKVSRNFDSAMLYTPIAFEGNKESVSFVSLIQTDEKLGGDRGIGQVRFFYDTSSRAIKRQVLNLNQIYKNSNINAETVLGNASSFKVSFLGMDKQDKTFHWMEEWVDRPKDLPVAVRFEFKWSSAAGERPVKKTFMIPAGGI